MNATRSSWAIATCLGVVAFLVAAKRVEAGTYYTITDLGALTNDLQSSATGLNNSGQVVGWSGGSTTYPFLYSGGMMQTQIGVSQISALNISIPLSINNNGDIVGNANSQGFLDSNGTITPLGTGTVAERINNLGQIAGASGGIASVYSNGIWYPIGSLRTGSLGKQINDGGLVTGTFLTTSGAEHAFLAIPSGDDRWVTQDLGTLGGTNSYGKSVNDKGQVIGESEISPGSDSSHAFLYDYSTGKRTDLGRPGGNGDDATFTPESINDSGQAVAYYVDYTSGASDPFLYSNGVWTDLNTLIDPNSGWTLHWAWEINNSGSIVGYGWNQRDDYSWPQAFLLTPPQAVPEPISMIFFGTGLVGVVGYVARRRNR